MMNWKGFIAFIVQIIGKIMPAILYERYKHNKAEAKEAKKTVEVLKKHAKIDVEFDNPSLDKRKRMRERHMRNP